MMIFFLMCSEAKRNDDDDEQQDSFRIETIYLVSPLNMINFSLILFKFFFIFEKQIKDKKGLSLFFFLLFFELKKYKKFQSIVRSID